MTAHGSDRQPVEDVHYVNVWHRVLVKEREVEKLL